MHIKLLTAIGKFLDKGYITQYEIEGYFGFAYLTIQEFNIDTMERVYRKLKFDIVDDEVIMEEVVEEDING